MKIGGVYILTKRSIMRMIAVLATVFNTICFSTATSEDLILANRCSNAALSLKAMEPSLAFDSSRIVVPDHQYHEFKTLYLLKKPPRGEIPHVSAKHNLSPRQPPTAAKRRYRTPHPGELRQDDVAAVFGVSRQTVVRWEKAQTVDGPDNASNPWGYYRSLRTNPELRDSFELLSRQAKSYLSAKETAIRQGRRFRMTFVRFKEDWHKHIDGKM